ncbi:MAG: hypothetical protein J5726_11265 [Treponema sp.]|nr:hypothetical protein [Treponema sp.]
MKKNVLKTVLMSILLGGIFLLSSCQFSPSSTTVTIKNESGVEIAYWLEYRLGSMQDLGYEAPTLASGESKTWTISAKLSATAEKEWGLVVYVMKKSELDIYKKSHKDKSDSDVLMYASDVPRIHNSFDAADSYNIEITDATSSSGIKLK